ncbi:hypothetical protein [Microbispora sp. NBRC 16548]|uniref:hypothetical protein n=1 Tax=Microbispora sp. NBRC 16548 TaxID=3030994 RepID=UPI002553D167|nr:hypothetical protein [Microbispora sp. NBRC 16548]
MVVFCAAGSPVAEVRTAGFEASSGATRAGRGRCVSLVPARSAVPVESLPPLRDDETGEGGRDREEGPAVRSGRLDGRDAPVS